MATCIELNGWAWERSCASEEMKVNQLNEKEKRKKPQWKELECAFFSSVDAQICTLFIKHAGKWIGWPGIH